MIRWGKSHTRQIVASINEVGKRGAIFSAYDVADGLDGIEPRYVSQVCSRFARAGRLETHGMIQQNSGRWARGYSTTPDGWPPDGF